MILALRGPKVFQDLREYVAFKEKKVPLVLLVPRVSQGPMVPLALLVLKVFKDHKDHRGHRGHRGLLVKFCPFFVRGTERLLVQELSVFQVPVVIALTLHLIT